MKKLFTIDHFMVAVVAALGYGFGDAIARLSGWPDVMCIVACLVVGMVMEMVISKIVFSKTVQKSTKNRVLTYVGIVFFFLLAQFIATRWMGISMVDYVQEEFMFVIVLPVVGLFVNLLIRAFRVWKIRKRYGDGSEGYVFDVKNKDLEEVNQQNQEVHGKYDTSLEVRTRTGIYVGDKYKNTLAFLGIPYAKPPVGALRWKAPEALPSSQTVHEAKHFGSSAIQVEHQGSIVKYHRQSEDCLTLNIATAKEKTKAKKPVLVLFHHGDFASGGTVDPLSYGGDYVNTHQDVVFVSFNYRLGIFGFIDLSEVPGGESCPDALNLGLLDQIAALKWIKENISAFGGDPERITVIGFESGATSICLLAASEQAKGLFQRAFIFNGSPDAAYETPENSRALASALLKETNTSTMAELQQLDTGTLKDAAQKLWTNLCAPTCDGTLVPADVYQAYKNGAASGIEFIVGITKGEMQGLRSSIGSGKFEHAVNVTVDNLQNSMADSVQKYLQTKAASSSEDKAKSKLVQKWVSHSIYRVAAKLFQGGNTVHLMYWDEEALIKNLGSGTVDVLATLLGNENALQLYGNVMNKDLSELLQFLLVKFASGDALELYRNELSNYDGFKWNAFPHALIIANGKAVPSNKE